MSFITIKGSKHGGVNDFVQFSFHDAASKDEARIGTEIRQPAIDLAWTHIGERSRAVEAIESSDAGHQRAV